MLEDFKALERFAAVSTYYDLLQWVNGADSTLETNESALLSARANDSPKHPALGLRVYGRTTVFARDLAFNSEPHNVQFIAMNLADHLKQMPDFPGDVEIGVWQTLFTEINQRGHIVTIEYRSWGNSEDEAMSNLNQVFLALRGATEHVSGLLAQGFPGSLES